MEVRGSDTALVFDADGAGPGAGADVALIKNVAATDLLAASFTATAGGTPVVVDPSPTSVITGTSRADTLIGTAARDVMRGLGGNDVLHGGAGNDRIDGGEGNDQLFGDEGHDLLLGGLGNDSLTGGAGNDVLNGGLGNDQLWGGSGNDVFGFAQDGSRDIIRDFQAGLGAGDMLDLSAFQGLQSFEDVMALTRNDADGNAVLHLAGNTKVTLFGVGANQLAADDFSFAPTAIAGEQQVVTLHDSAALQSGWWFA
jgi:Ca2+-binding RTX toxin-like protein